MLILTPKEVEERDILPISSEEYLENLFSLSRQIKNRLSPRKKQKSGLYVQNNPYGAKPESLLIFSGSTHLPLLSVCFDGNSYSTIGLDDFKDKPIIVLAWGDWQEWGDWQKYEGHKPFLYIFNPNTRLMEFTPRENKGHEHLSRNKLPPSFNLLTVLEYLNKPILFTQDKIETSSDFFKMIGFQPI